MLLLDGYASKSASGLNTYTLFLFNLYKQSIGIILLQTQSCSLTHPYFRQSQTQMLREIGSIMIFIILIAWPTLKNDF